jgi:hypothetical protein
METNHSNRLAAWLETAWLERYLDRQLTAEEVVWFEIYVFDKPDLLSKIDMDSDLRDGTFSAKPDSADPPMMSNVAELSAAGSRQSTTVLRAFAVAASMLAAVGVGWTGREWSRSDSDAAIVANPTLVRLYGPGRGIADSLVCVENAKSPSNMISVEAMVPASAVDVTMRFGDKEISGLAPSSTGTISSLVPRQVVAAAKSVELTYVVNGKRIDQNTPGIDLLLTGKQIGQSCP